MASNDMYVVMYKIIAYLYSCMKKGEQPEDACYSYAALGIPEPYWTTVMAELVEHGYIKGVTVVRHSGGTSIMPVGPYVTMEGVAFAQENTMMAKAKRFLQDAKASVPFV